MRPPAKEVGTVSFLAPCSGHEGCKLPLANIILVSSACTTGKKAYSYGMICVNGDHDNHDAKKSGKSGLEKMANAANDILGNINTIKHRVGHMSCQLWRGHYDHWVFPVQRTQPNTVL